jgi:hypothetical protein
LLLRLPFFIVVRVVSLQIQDIKKWHDDELKNQRMLLSLLSASNEKLKTYDSLISAEGENRRTSLQGYSVNDFQKILTRLLTTVANQEAAVAETKASIQAIEKLMNPSPRKMKKANQKAGLRAKMLERYESSKAA